MLSTVAKKNLLLIGLILGEILLLSFIVIGLDHFIYPALIATILLYIATPAIDALETHAKIPSVSAIMAEVPAANPSIPSVRLAPLETAAMIKMAINTNTIHA